MKVTITGRVGNGGAGVTIYRAEADEGAITIAAMQDLQTGSTYDLKMQPSRSLFNGHQVDYMVNPHA